MACQQIELDQLDFADIGEPGGNHFASADIISHNATPNTTTGTPQPNRDEISAGS